jgi:hypothetical protein
LISPNFSRSPVSQTPSQTLLQYVDAQRSPAKGTLASRTPKDTPHCNHTTNKSQIFQEISQKKAFSEQQLLIVRQQKTARTREARLLELTSSEVSSLPKDTKVYEGVGKMYV